MANYRTLTELKPYKGWQIQRLHINGRYEYFGGKDGTVFKESSLKELKMMIDKEV